MIRKGKFAKFFDGLFQLRSLIRLLTVDIPKDSREIEHALAEEHAEKVMIWNQEQFRGIGEILI